MAHWKQKMNNKENLENLDTLKNTGVDYCIFDDFNSSTDMLRYDIALQKTTPTLILKTKNNHIIIIFLNDTRIAFNKLKQILNDKDISLADSETVFKLTGTRIKDIEHINTDLLTFIDQQILQNKNYYSR